MESEIGTWVAIITAIGGVATGIVGMLIKGRLDFEKLRRQSRSDCQEAVQQERIVHDAQVLRLEQELEAVSSVFALVQTKHTALPACYMTLEGVFVSITPTFAEALEPLGINADDLIGNDGLKVLPQPVIGHLRLLQAKAVVDGGAVATGFRFGEGLLSWTLVMEASTDHRTIVCKLFPE